MRHQDRIEAWILEADARRGGEDSAAVPKRLPPGTGASATGLPEPAREERERREIHDAWDQLRGQCQGLGLPADFGDDRVRRWSRPRPEGVLFGTPLALAASLLFMVSLVPAMGCMRELGLALQARSTLERGEVLGASLSQSVEPGSVWSAQAGRPLQLELRGGRSLRMDEGRISILSARHWRLEHTPRVRLDVELPAGETLFEVPGGVLRSRDARYSLHSGGGGGLRLEVQGGTVCFEGAGGETLRRLGPGRGLDIVAPRGGEDLRSAPTPPVPDRSRRAIPPRDSNHGIEGDTEDGSNIGNGEQRQGLREGAAEGWALAVLEGRLHDDGTLTHVEDRRLRLTRIGVAAQGHFVGAQDPLVALRRHELLEAARATVLERREIPVDAEGYFRDELQPGHWDIEVVAPGYQDRVLASRTLYPGRELWCELRLRPETVLRGMILDPEGRVIEGALVSLRQRRVRCGPDGRFVLPGCGPVETVLVEAEGWAPATWTIGEGQGQDSLILQPGATWTVDVNARMGGQVDGAGVVAAWLDGASWRRAVGRTGPGGSRVLTGLPTDRKFVLITQAPGWQPDRRVLRDRGLGMGRERVELAAASSLELQVQGPSQQRLLATGSLWLGAALRVGTAGEDAGLRFEGLADLASWRGLVAAPEHRVRALALGNPAGSRGVLSLERESGDRRLVLSTPAGEPLPEAWALWVVRDLSTSLWVHARCLPAVDRGVLQLPDLGVDEFAAAELEVVVAVGGAGFQVQWLDDEGSSVQAATLERLLQSR